MSGHQHCINCLQESDILYQYPCVACGWSPEQHSTSGLYLSPGTILHGQYQIARMLGHGGFGITYLAWDNLLEIKLAIKEYMPRDFATRNASNSEISTFAGDAKENFTYGLERFLDEARTLAKFQQHTGIVSVLNVFYGNSTGYMVMEYVDGLTLKEYLVDKDKLTWEQTLQLFMPVMDALRAVHKSGMLHRDISPDNIYLCQDNRVKLLDFGSARFALGGHSRSLSVVVKPGYAPEEQYRTKGKQGSWTDVYSVAASMYRCITGLVPPDALDRLDEDELKKPSVLGVKISQGAEKEIMAALAIKAENRTQTIESLQDGLLTHSNVEPEAIVVKPKTKSKPQAIVEPVTITPTDDLKVASIIAQRQNRQRYYPKDESNNNKLLPIVFLLLVPIIWLLIKEAIAPQDTSAPIVSPIQQQPNIAPKQSIKEQIQLALKYYAAEDYDEAAKWYQKAADQGDKNAQNNLGHMYANGEGVKQNYSKALEWYQKSADQGVTNAQVSVGWYYMNGFGNLTNDIIDYKKAIYWNQRAADNGDAEGFNNLGWLYENGLGVEKNLTKAAELYQTAVTKGIKNGAKQKNIEEAQRRLANINALIKANEKQTLQEAPVDAEAQIKLANESYKKKNYKQAIDLYRKAAEQGNIAGQYNLGIMYEKGLGVKKDATQAIAWYQKGANQKDKDSLRNLINAQIKLAGQFYQDKNFKDSVLWYRKVADLGSAVGQYNLGILYEKGLGVAKDDNQAHSWFQKAADQGDADAIKKLKENNNLSKVSYAIGDKLADGSIVFYVDTSGTHGTAAKSSDLANSTWEEAKININKLGVGWRLPIKEELNILYLMKKGVAGFSVDGFDGDRYWSSTESDAGFVWSQRFSDGKQDTRLNINAFAVRAVRSF